MKKGNLIKISLLIIAVIVIVIVGIFISKTNSEEKNTNTLNNSQNTTIDANNTITNTNNDSKENNSDIVGTWNTYQAIDSQTAEKIDDLTTIFGSSYTSYGSYLKLNEDGTFLDSIYPITSGETSTTGTYTVEKDYYELGDCYVFLKYSDGRTVTIQQVNYGDNIPVLSYYPDDSKYQFDLKK